MLMNKSRGRRPGGPDTRSEILAAAKSAFAEHGYRGATVRRIAEDAGVDIRLIAHHFGNKRGLFREAMTLPISPSDALARALAGPRETWAAGILTAALTAWDSPDTGQPLRRLLAEAVSDSEQGRALSEFLERELIDPLAQRLDGPQRRRRATAAVTVVAGMILQRYALDAAPMKELSQREVIATLGPLIDAALRPRPARSARGSGG
jgi:AcrR family transcriptional regulator